MHLYLFLGLSYIPQLFLLISAPFLLLFAAHPSLAKELENLNALLRRKYTNSTSNNISTC